MTIFTCKLRPLLSLAQNIDNSYFLRPRLLVQMYSLEPYKKKMYKGRIRFPGGEQPFVTNTSGISVLNSV